MTLVAGSDVLNYTRETGDGKSYKESIKVLINIPYHGGRNGLLRTH